MKTINLSITPRTIKVSNYSEQTLYDYYAEFLVGNMKYVVWGKDCTSQKQCHKLIRRYIRQTKKTIRKANG